MPNKISHSEALKNANMTLEQAFFESIIPACCSDGCMVEPDGKCEHGFESVLSCFL